MNSSLLWNKTREVFISVPLKGPASAASWEHLPAAFQPKENLVHEARVVSCAKGKLKDSEDFGLKNCQIKLPLEIRVHLQTSGKHPEGSVTGSLPGIGTFCVSPLQ